MCDKAQLIISFIINAWLLKQHCSSSSAAIIVISVYTQRFIGRKTTAGDNFTSQLSISETA